MKRAAREVRTSPTAFSNLLRAGGYGAVLAGALFPVWGYVHHEGAPLYLDATAHVLAFIVPVLFMVGLAALYARYARRAARLRLGETGIILGSIGSALGAVRALVDMVVPSLYPHDAVSGRILLLLDVWTPTLFSGLLLAGLAFSATSKAPEPRKVLVAMGSFGWGYLFTNPGNMFEARLVHIGFGLLFSLGWVTLGLMLWGRGSQQAIEPRA